MKKAFYILYAIICYGIFFVTFLYLIGFVENISKFSFVDQLSPLFSKTLDAGESSMAVMPAILINLLLIALFGIQHSVMARPAFKKKWTRLIPQPIERSTYVLFTSIVLIILFYFWQPVKINFWNLSQSPIGNLFFIISLLGWVLLLISTFLINHFDLFGLRQPYMYAKGKPTDKLKFRKPGFYLFIRHPIYFSFLLAFWFAPLMTLGHLVFNLGMTVYIFTGIYHEEKDLIKAYGEMYKDYRRDTPMVIPYYKPSKSK